MSIEYPYLPEGKEILYVSKENSFMKEAREIAKRLRSNLFQPHALVVVKNDEIISWGSIGENYHADKGCERIKHNMPTGTGYDLCPGCNVENHSEANAIKRARESGVDVIGADIYFWGHWWCCKPCWDKMIEAGIKNVYLLEGSEKLFRRESPENILGKQFNQDE